jgi:hypothetical protein
MPLTFKEEIALQAAFMEIKRERRLALQKMFEGTQLIPKSRVEDAKTLLAEAKNVKKAVSAIPGVSVPKLGVPSLNINLFKDIDLRLLVNFRIPSLNLPGINLAWIPDIKLGLLWDFDLPTVRLNLKGILKYKDLLPDISLRALVYALLQKFPDITIPTLLIDLSKILSIDFDVLFPDIRLKFPEFFTFDFNIEIPHFSLPDVNFPNLPSIDLPSIDLSQLDLSAFRIPNLLSIPGIDKVFRLLFELFDSFDIGDIIEELGLDFLEEFISGAIPFVSQVVKGAKVVKLWGTVASDWHKSRKTVKQREFLLPGNARDACEAVRVLLIRSRNEHAALASIETAQLAVSTAGLFADLGGATGPAVSAAGAIAKTCQKIVIMGARYKEMKKVNLLLTTSVSNLTSNIFEVSPLLGCYYLANNTTSTVLNLLSSNIIEDNWMTDWENNKRKYLDPLIKECQRFIQESRYVLFPIRQDIGMYVKKGTFEMLKESAALYLKKKVGISPSTATVSTHRYIGK